MSKIPIHLPSAQIIHVFFGMPSNLRVALLKRRQRPDSFIHDVNSDEAEYEESEDILEELPSLGLRSIVPPAKTPALFSPLKSDDCFTTALEIDIPSVFFGNKSVEECSTVRAYYSPPRMGISPSSTVMVFHHGAGFGALSYALTAKEITIQTQGEVGLLAYDCRGHGRSNFPANVKKDMSLNALTHDLIAVLHAMFPDPAQRPSFILVGHSMGGAVVVEAAHAMGRETDSHIKGVVMIDIVEDTSLQLLPSMGRIVRQRPEGFVNLESAIQWHVQTRTIRNTESARRSVPSLVHLDENYTTVPWRWNADLVATEPFWTGWFEGLSSKFLSCQAARLLLLAETDRLDQTLMIGQMQGKFQLVISSQAGHCIQEDAPHTTANTLVQFWRRNDRIPLGLWPVGRS